MTAESTAEPLKRSAGSGRTTEVRLRQSSYGARVAAITTLIVFLLACLLGQLRPSPDASALRITTNSRRRLAERDAERDRRGPHA